MKVQSELFAMTAAVVALVACTTTNPKVTNNSSGGSGNSSGGSSGSTAGATAVGPLSGASCDNVTACGGDLVGTWAVASACLKVSGELDLQKWFGFSCPAGQVTGALQVAGTLTANSDGTFKDATTTTGTEQITLPVECLTLSGAKVTCQRLGDVMASGSYKTVTCTDAATGGCSCSATIQQDGSVGRVSSDAQKDGNYTKANNALTITQDNSSYAYCVANTTLSLSAQGTGPTTTGTIMLQSAAPSGSGGSSGSGGVGIGSAGTGGAAGMAGAGGGGPLTRGKGPCDIYAAANVPCAAAYSMVRALSSTYTGPLYQVRNMSSATNTGSGGMTQDIGMTGDGYADTTAQDMFCKGTICTVSILYDQSGNKNDLKTGSPGGAGNGPRSGEQDYESSATKGAVIAGGHKVYSLYMNEFEGYRTPLNVAGTKVPVGDTSEGIYMLADGKHAGGKCCWDFGNVSTDPKAYHTMNTLFLGTGFWGKGVDPGPWFEGDFENGVWAGGANPGDPGGKSGMTANSKNPAMTVDFALGLLKTSSGKYALRMADVATATDLATAYDGAAPPKSWDNQGGILLGIGGDNSNNSFGTFYEGAIVSGLPTDATDLEVLKNIQAVGYKKQ